MHSDDLPNFIKVTNHDIGLPNINHKLDSRSTWISFSMTNSLRKVAPRRTHRERAQPASRKKLGLLEKHKDYVLRARDYHRKEKRIKSLREKARDRNPDEFYFGMINKKTKVTTATHL
jgi:hypothetical protein